MRKKLYRMSEDHFDNIKINIVSPDRIEETFLASRQSVGDFEISSNCDAVIRGFIYSSNPYVACDNPSFEGKECKISYKLVNSGFTVNDVIEGQFIIVFNGGMKAIPYTFKFDYAKPNSSIGTINSLTDFANLAKKNMPEANMLLHTDSFLPVMYTEPDEIKLLFEGYKAGALSLANLEEFLVACKLKDRLKYDINTTTRSYFDLEENIKDVITIEKNTWGFVDIHVSCDSDFITIEKEHINSDYFLGNTMEFNFYIHKSKLHAGINSAKIVFTTIDDCKEIVIEASSNSKDYEIDYYARQRRLEYHKLSRDYENYRLNRMTTGDWCKSTVAILDKFIKQDSDAREDGLNVLEPHLDREFCELVKAHTYIANKQKQEALWIIADLKREISDKKSVNWAYLLYLCTLIEPEISYVNRLTQEIEVIFREHPEDVRVFWFLLFLREEYVTNTTTKLKAIYRWINAGVNSPYLYIEAFNMYQQDPYIISSFSNASIKVLNWARKKGALTHEMCVQMLRLLDDDFELNSINIRLIQEMYRIVPTKPMLTGILSFLLKKQAFSPDFFSWYELGIQEEIRLTGLYEAYILSLDLSKNVKLPQMLTMYFRYNCNLSYDRKAYVYAYVVMNKQKDRSLYEQYVRTIEMFAMEQMQLGRISDSLAIIYQDVLDNGIISEELAALMAPLLHTVRISVINANVNRVLVYQEAMAKPHIANIVDNTCYVPIYSKKYKIFLEMKDGTLVSNPDMYLKQELLQAKDLENNLKTLSPSSLAFVIRFFEELRVDAIPGIITKSDNEVLSIKDLNCIETFIASKEISPRYKQNLYPIIIDFLQKHSREELIESHLLNEIDYIHLDGHTLSFVITLLITQGYFDKAYDLLRNYNGSQVEAKYVHSLCSHLIEEDLVEDSDDFFISLCGSLIGETELNPYVIKMLNARYVGPNIKMIMLFEQVRDLHLSTTALAERIIMQSLFEEHLYDRSDEIFAAYVTTSSNRMIVEAYLSYKGHEYILNDRALSNLDYELIYRRINKSSKQNDSIKLAYLKHLCLLDELNDSQYTMLDSLLNEYISKNIYFSFYKKMDSRLLVKYHLYDKFFVEFKGNPRDKIVIQYELNGNLYSEDMVEMYQGVYVKQFVLFFSDYIKYKIFSRNDTSLELASNDMSFDELLKDGSSRYDMLNQIKNSILYYDETSLEKLMIEYQGLDYVTKQLFSKV